MEALYRRASRTPENLSLDLRANDRRQTVPPRPGSSGSSERYGKAVVKGCECAGSSDASQRAFEEALDTIPDGVLTSERLIPRRSR